MTMLIYDQTKNLQLHEQRDSCAVNLKKYFSIFLVSRQDTNLCTLVFCRISNIVIIQVFGSKLWIYSSLYPKSVSKYKKVTVEYYPNQLFTRCLWVTIQVIGSEWRSYFLLYVLKHVFFILTAEPRNQENCQGKSHSNTFDLSSIEHLNGYASGQVIFQPLVEFHPRLHPPMMRLSETNFRSSHGFWSMPHNMFIS